MKFAYPRNPRLHDAHIKQWECWKRGKWRSKSMNTFESHHRAMYAKTSKQYKTPRKLKFLADLGE